MFGDFLLKPYFELHWVYLLHQQLSNYFRKID